MRPLIPPKWYSAVWAVLIVCSLLRNIVSIVTNIQLVANDGAAQILLTLFVEVIFSGVLPAAICYFCALIFYYIVARRVRAFCRRDDFVYLVMAFTAAARVIMGIVESTALINSAVLSYTSLAFNSTVLTAAYFIMFFAVIKPRYLNDKTAYDSFNVFASVYFFFQGLGTIIPCTVYLLVATGTSVGASFVEALEIYTNTTLVVDKHMEIACIIALCLYFLWLVAAVTLSLIMRKKAKNFVPEQPQAPNDGSPFGGTPFDGSPFEETATKQEKPVDKVFDEFDL